MISPNEIARVQESFVDCLPIADKVAGVFYARLFAAAPETRRLFTTDITVQGRKLVMTLASIVDGLSRVEQILPAMRELARRHVRYGVVHWHYDVVGSVLLETLRELLGPSFDGEVEAAWGAAYALVVDTMLDATREAA